MNIFQRTAKNISLLIFSQAIGYGLNFIFFINVARHLGAKDFGVFSFALAFLGIFAVFTDFGYKKLIAREVAIDKSLSNQYLGNIISFEIILSFLAVCSMWLIVYVLGCSIQIQLVVFIISFSLFFRSVEGIFYANFQAHEKLEFEALGRVIYAVLLLSGALFVVHLKGDVVSLAFAYSLVNLFVFLYAVLASYFVFQLPKVKFDFNFWKMSFVAALPFGLIELFEIIYHWIDTIMLSIMKGDVVVGWYNVAYRLFLVSICIPTAFNMAIFPIMSRYYVTSKTKLAFLFERYFKYLTIMGVALGISTLVLAEKVVLFFFGNEYVASILTLQILIWAAVLIFINSAGVLLLLSTNRSSVVTRAMGYIAGLNILFNLFLIPRFNYLGASAATVISEGVVSVMIIAFALRTKYGFKWSTLGRYFFSVGLAAVVMFCIYNLLSKLSAHWLIIFPALAGYVAVIFSLKMINKIDWLVFKIIFRSKADQIVWPEIGYIE